MCSSAPHILELVLVLPVLLQLKLLQLPVLLLNPLLQLMSALALVEVFGGGGGAGQKGHHRGRGRGKGRLDGK